MSRVREPDRLGIIKISELLKHDLLPRTAQHNIFRHRNVTDRQTDRIALAITTVCIASNVDAL